MFKIIFTLFALITIGYAGNVSQVCVNKDSTTYFPVGDERGISVLTKQEVNRDCNITTTVQGACLQWEDKVDKYTIEPSDYNVYRTMDNSSSIGTLFATLGAYDQLEHLWSGWKGYCESGTKENFDWASDPMFWAGQAMSLFTADYGNTAGTATNATEQAAQEAAKKQIEESTVLSTLKSAQGSTLDAIKSIAVKAGIDMGAAAAKCTLAAGLNMASNLYSRFATGADDIGCDPIDEFCSDEAGQTKESDILTMDKSEYEQLVTDNPDYAKYLVVLDEQNDIMTLRYKQPTEVVDTSNMDLNAMKELQDKVRNMQFMISTAVTTLQLAGCIGSNMATGGKTTIGDTAGGAYANDGRFSVKNMASMGVNFIPAPLLGPYGPFIKIGLQVALQFATSFEHIDTCHDEKDAQTAGSRHEKTQQSLQYNLCHLTDIDCAQQSIFGGCSLDGYHYCCFDQILTKVLIEQIKAQLGRDWAHCTGISIRDLKFVSFVQCTDAQMQTGFDGSKQVGGYDPKGAYQYKQKCVDLTEFKTYLKSQIGVEIDLSDFDSIFSDIKSQK